MVEFAPLRVIISPPVANPVRVIALAEGKSGSGNLGWLARARPRAVRSQTCLEQAIRDGQVADFRFAEWILALKILRSLERIEPALDPAAREAAYFACRQAWQLAADKAGVRMVLIRNIVKHLVDPKHEIPECLDLTVKDAPVSRSKALKLGIEVINALQNGNQEGLKRIVRLSREDQTPVRTFLGRHGCPRNSYPVARAMSLVCREFISNGRSRSDEVWLVDCLTEMPPPVQRKAVAELLAAISPEKAGGFPHLVMWLKDRYKVLASGSDELPPSLIDRLRGWVGAVNFKDFEQIVRSLVASGLLDSSSSPGRSSEVDKMWRRYAFWSNYRTRFERLRILLPESSRRYFPVEQFSASEVAILDVDTSRETEICIFDFGMLIVVEFFRETETIFVKHPSNSLRHDLFDRPRLSPNIIRYFCIRSAGEWKDHFHLWQRFRERDLAELGIYPDLQEGLFEWDPRRSKWPYSSKQGIQTRISQEDLLDRKIQVENWERKIEQIKSKARDWASRVGY